VGEEMFWERKLVKKIKAKLIKQRLAGKEDNPSPYQFLLLKPAPAGSVPEQAAQQS